MQATLNQPKSIETVVQERTPIQLIFIEAAIRKQQNFRESGDYNNMIRMYNAAADALDEIGRLTHSQKTNELLGELWEQAGKQLRDTRNYAEHYHCIINAMAHYKQANNHERFLQAFRNLYGK